MFDWQQIAVALIVALAALYVGRRGLKRLGSFRARGAASAADCSTGCGKCGDRETAVPAAPRIVQISRTKRPATQRRP